MKKSLRTLSIPALAVFGVAVLTAGVVFAASTPTFNLTIVPGSLGIDIVNGEYATVAAPTVKFTDATAGFDCATTTGTLGEATQQIYITNPDASDGGYSVTLAPTAGTTTWKDSGTNTIAINDETATGCETGRMTISNGEISNGRLSTDATTGISVNGGSFSTANTSVTLVSASAASEDVSEVVANGFTIDQTIPARTPASTYSLPMTLSIISSL
ncbi:MAG: hypothetical protein QMB51_00705 [Patescibacteria group bacterium]